MIIYCTFRQLFNIQKTNFMKGLIFLLIFGLMTSSALYAVNPVLDVIDDGNGITVVDNAEQGGWWNKTKSFVAKTFNKVKDFLEESAGKTIAIIAHFTWVGTLIAYVMNMDKKNELASFYIRQNLGILILGLIIGVIAWLATFALALAGIGLIGYLISLVLWVFLLVLWVISLLGALKGKEKLVPAVGKMFQKWFKNI